MALTLHCPFLLLLQPWCHVVPKSLTIITFGSCWAAFVQGYLLFTFFSCKWQQALQVELFPLKTFSCMMISNTAGLFHGIISLGDGHDKWKCYTSAFRADHCWHCHYYCWVNCVASKQHPSILDKCLKIYSFQMILSKSSKAKEQDVFMEQCMYQVLQKHIIQPYVTTFEEHEECHLQEALPRSKCPERLGI